MPSTRRGPGAWLASVGLSLASLLLVLAAAELVVRLTWQQPRYDASLTSDERDALPVYETLRDLGRKHLDGQHRGVRFRTNDRGLRGPTYSRRARAGTRRIGIGGDSFTMGWGVEEESAYPAVVERMLDAGWPSVDAEVLNIGMAGLAAGGVMHRLRQHDRYYRFDALVYGFTINDIEGEGYERRRVGLVWHEMAQRERRALHSGSKLWRVMWPVLLSLRERISPTRGSRTEELLYNYFENDEAWARFESELDELAAETVGKGRCGLVLIHTQLAELGWLHPYRSVYERVAEAAEYRGLVVVRSFDAFRGRYEPALWVRPTDPHPNAAAHRVLARVLADGILALPDACWTARARALPRRAP